MGSFDEFTKDLNQKPVSTRSTLTNSNAPLHNIEQDYMDIENNSSRRPLYLSEFGREPDPQDPPEPYNSSGRTFNLTDFMGKGLNNSSSDSDRTLNASEFDESISPKQLGPNRIYNDSGRVLSLSDFGPTIVPESRKYRENMSSTFRAPEQRTFMDEISCTQNKSDSYYDPHRPLKLSNMDGFQRNRFQGSPSYNDTANTRTPWQSKMSPIVGTPSTSIQDVLRNPFSPTLRSVPYDPTSNCQPGRRQHVRSPGLRRAEYPVCLPECPSPSQDQLVQCLQNGDFSQLSASKPSSSAGRHPLFNTLVKDNYYPGAIQAAVNGQIDFNKVAFDAVFDGNNIPSEVEPEKVPMTLLEAFDMRIKYERDLQDNTEGGRPQRRQKRTLRNKNDAEDGGAIFWTHRDELKLASVVDIDLASNIRDQPDTDLTRALASLFKAEKMNDFDRRVHLAEQAIRSASPGEQEKAALRSKSSFKVDLQKDEVKSNNNYTPIEIISYIGTTKPAE